jgi:uncharacterized protein (DUF885 family)
LTKNKRASTGSGLSSATKTNSNSTWSKSTRQTVSTKRKDDYDQAKLYLQGLVRDFETYTQNSGEHGKKGYESANQIADVGEKILKYIQEITSASVASNEKAAEFAANVSEESKAKDAQFQAMTAQIQALTNTVALLSTQIAAAAKEHGGGGGGCGGGSGNGSGNERTFKHQKQHHVPYSLAISINGTFLLIHGIASTLWAFQYVFLIIYF